MGIVNEVVEAPALQPAVAARAAELAAAPTAALGLAKRLLDQSLQSTLQEMVALEAMAQAILYTTDDHAAAREAFASKTKPRFIGA